MKKVLFFILSVIIFCSCRGPMGPQGEGTTWKIVDISVTQWDYSNFSDNNYFFAKYDVPALTSFVFTDGNVQAYIYMMENGEKIQHELPYTLHLYETDTKTGETFYYTRTVDFVFGVGWVQFEVRESDFAYEKDVNMNPAKMDFRLVMTY